MADAERDARARLSEWSAEKLHAAAWLEQEKQFDPYNDEAAFSLALDAIGVNPFMVLLFPGRITSPLPIGVVAQFT